MNNKSDVISGKLEFCVLMSFFDFVGKCFNHLGH